MRYMKTCDVFGCAVTAGHAVDMSHVPGWIESGQPPLVFHACTFHRLALAVGEAVRLGDGGVTVSLGTAGDTPGE
ncbi:hypothetical protein QE414_001924 [Microbacterium sp. SORGH_AS 344]|nr:hypothetical protein [Microbacterium sp. SORGH_AS_0344]